MWSTVTSEQTLPVCGTKRDGLESTAVTDIMASVPYDTGCHSFGSESILIAQAEQEKNRKAS
jgi:hypothetical protein